MHGVTPFSYGAVHLQTSSQPCHCPSTTKPVPWANLVAVQAYVHHLCITCAGLGKAFFSGEGLFVTKLSGSGVAFITSLGAIHGVHLQAGQEYIIDNEHLVAWHASMTYKIENMGGMMTAMVSSEGKVCRFSGPGTVYMQTRNPTALAAYMRSIGVGKAQ